MSANRSLPTDTLSLASDLEPGYCPLRSRFGPVGLAGLAGTASPAPPFQSASAAGTSPACCRLGRRGSDGGGSDSGHGADHSRGQLQLARLHDMYRTKLAAATSSRRAAAAAAAAASATAAADGAPSSAASRCTSLSLSLSDVLHGLGHNGATSVSDCERDGDGDGEHAASDAGSIYSEPPYRLQQQQQQYHSGQCNGTLCDSCRRGFAPPSWCVSELGQPWTVPTGIF